jgi:uncharacterized protein YjbI with pentapeptide repeats
VGARDERRRPGWPACETGGCPGIRLDDDTSCWEHAPDRAVHRALERIADGGRLDARGVHVTASLLERILAAAPSDAEGDPHLQRADFRQCRFEPDASFTRVRFEGRTRFDEARFDGTNELGAPDEPNESADFTEASFGGAVWFEAARFAGEARFTGASFAGATWFTSTRFRASGRFDDATFGANVSFHQAQFREDAHLSRARFTGDLSATEATVGQDAVFSEAVFDQATVFAGGRVGGIADFTRSTFATSQQLGPLAADRVLLGETAWHARARIQVVTTLVQGQGARFLDGVHLEVDRGRAPSVGLELDGADLTAPSIVGHGGPFPGLVVGARDHGGDDRGEANLPQLLSLHGADVAGLALSRVDLGRCLFDGAHNLDRLRTDAVRFAAPPRGRTSRDVIAEERNWRAAHALGRRSRDRWAREIGPGPEATPPDGLRADQVAALYRSLRRGREGLKDEPGAADLYYGEMEMRRQATSPRHPPGYQGSGRSRPAAAAGEHLILTLYWFTSGYGLRAWRALAALCTLVVAAGFVLTAWGLHDLGPPGEEATLADALLISARACTAVLAGPDDRMTAFGEWLQIGLRLLGPALLGLALLAIRGRVRR